MAFFFKLLQTLKFIFYFEEDRLLFEWFFKFWIKVLYSEEKLLTFKKICDYFFLIFVQFWKKNFLFAFKSPNFAEKLSIVQLNFLINNGYNFLIAQRKCRIYKKTLIFFNFEIMFMRIVNLFDFLIKYTLKTKNTR